MRSNSSFTLSTCRHSTCRPSVDRTFYMSPVSKKLNMYRIHVACIRSENRPLSTCIQELDMFNCWTHVSSRSKDAGRSFYTSPQRGQERSTCRHFFNVHEFTRSRTVIRILLATCRKLYTQRSTCSQGGLGTTLQLTMNCVARAAVRVLRL